MSNTIKPKINDQFWFNYSEKLIKDSHTNTDVAVKKLQNLVLWLWGIYTTYSVVGSSLQESNYPFIVTFLIALTSVSLILVYWGTAWVQMPVETSFDPRSPDEIEAAYKYILEIKISRFKKTLWLSLFSAFMVSLSLILMSTNAKNNQNKHEPSAYRGKNESTNIDYLFSKQLESLYIYFEKGSILPNAIHSLDKIENILAQQINKQNKYIIKITGFSSLEIVQWKNAISDNYQISMARANNIKKIILDLADKNNFNRENIIIDIFAFSNQNISKTNIMNHQANRKVKIEIIELVQNKTNPTEQIN